MSRELKNVQVTHVSFVDKAANKKKFFLTKAADTPNFEKEVRTIAKADDPQQLVYGVVYEPDVEDAHEDYMTAEAIEKAAHGFMENYQNIDKQHDFETQAGKVVESYIAPADISIGDEVITKGTWVLVTKASNEMWESIQKGEYTGYSLAGTAQTIEKATGDNYSRSLVSQQLELAKDAFVNAFYEIKWNGKTDSEKVSDMLSEISELQTVVASINSDALVAKTEKSKTGLRETIKSFFNTQKNESEGEEMKPEELKEILKEALNPVTDRLDALEKQDADKKTKKDKKVEDPEKDSENELVAAVKAAVAPLADRLDKIEKARTSNVVEATYQETTVEKADAVPDYVNAAFPIEE